MDSLTLDTLPSGSKYLETKRISGFQEGELEELRAMPHGQAEQKLLDMLDERNNGCGSYYHNGYGVYGVWFDNEYAYMNVGNNCD